MRLSLVLLLTVLTAPATAADDLVLVREELVDAGQREQQELQERAEALDRQARLTAQLLERQQHYIELLQAQIDALKDNGQPDE